MTANLSPLSSVPEMTLPPSDSNSHLASAVIHSSAEERAREMDRRILSALSGGKECGADLSTFSEQISSRVAQDRIDRIKLVALIRLGLNEGTSVEKYIGEVIGRGLITPGDLLAELSSEFHVVHR